MEIKHDGDIVYIDIEGDISFSNAQSIHKEILSSMNNEEKTAVVNLSKVDFMDSYGLSIFITLLKRVKENGGELILEYPQLGVQRFLEMTQLDKLMRIRKTEEPKTGEWPEAKSKK
ncbi:MAG: STAS domain-containing protein [Clostridiales bacterium]|nr:STAS domain-containing protein [Clostridiales bacterium]